MRAVDAVVHGRVQGVFFRDSTRQRAEALGVAGWVSNEPDGTVRAHLEGAGDALDRMVAWLHEGPAHARVERVDVVDGSAEGLDRFEVR